MAPSALAATSDATQTAPDAPLGSTTKSSPAEKTLPGVPGAQSQLNATNVFLAKAAEQNASKSKRVTNEENQSAPEAPAGPQNVFALVRPELSAKAPCAYKNCELFVYNPNPLRLTEDENKEKLKHIVIGESGEVREVEHFKTNCGNPYSVAKRDRHLHLDQLKPECLFKNETQAVQLRKRGVDFWTLYRDSFYGDVVFCSRDCARACYDVPPMRPVLSDKGWRLTRCLVRGGGSKGLEQEALKLLDECQSAEDVNFAEPEEGLCPLHLAVRNNLSPAFIRALLEKGAYVDGKNRSGYTALHYAAMNSGEDLREIPYGEERLTRSPIMDVLHEFSCDLDAQSSNGRTPLMWAAMNGNRQAVLWLVEHGCNRNLREHSLISCQTFDMTARDWAERKGEGLLCMLFDDIAKAEARKDWRPGMTFAGRGAASDPDDRESDLESGPRLAHTRGNFSDPDAVSSDSGPGIPMRGNFSDSDAVSSDSGPGIPVRGLASDPDARSSSS
eukprot:CAMPEP_0178992234 /NCGR_PEP_ID=MMETSP0795-20121207/5991_1 /TAXON_ID=88552 /ORGANISM="Amoebophrya sp., Strain Ameob2" /LENGTH=500 /DNA_ID=CAMNT_0020684073 /DNA_START=103 /DNA_END=1605 /DNA_ORIENTATION=-